MILLGGSRKADLVLTFDHNAIIPVTNIVHICHLTPHFSRTIVHEILLMFSARPLHSMLILTFTITTSFCFVTYALDICLILVNHPWPRATMNLYVDQQPHSSECEHLYRLQMQYYLWVMTTGTIETTDTRRKLHSFFLFPNKAIHPHIPLGFCILIIPSRTNYGSPNDQRHAP